MNDEKDTTAEAWVSTLLPRDAALSLVRAARLAKTLPVDSLVRAQTIRDAEKKVRALYPEAFRHDGGCCQR